MHRNRVIAICAVFGAIAVLAGFFIAGLSSAGQPITAADAVAGVSAPTPAATPDSLASDAPSAPPTSVEVAAVPTINPQIEEATSAPTAEAQAEPTSAPPAAEPSAAPAEPTAAPAPAATFAEYTIQPGDALLDIAKRYQVTMKDILALNQIANPDSLTVGQVLRIPTK